MFPVPLIEGICHNYAVTGLMLQTETSKPDFHCHERMREESKPGQKYTTAFGKTVQMMEDYYKVLGLKRGANSKEISAAYRAQALIHHPDKRKSSAADPESDEKFFEIKAAYQALQDPKIRAELDLQLIGAEERIKRDANMSAQRKQMRADLLSREKEASNAKKRELPNELKEEKEQTRKRTPSFRDLISNPEACLVLKCKFPDNIERTLALEMINSALNPSSLHEDPASTSSVAVEFRNPQDAYKALCTLPNDLIVKADWFKGYPPDGIKIEVRPKHTTPSTGSTGTSKPEEKVKYSKALEESVLERLKRKKLEKIQK